MSTTTTRLLTFAALFAAATLFSACNSIAKQPGRCVGCCYDQCIVPIGSPQSAIAERPLGRAVQAKADAAPHVVRQMAY